jgi:hypothetical protein
VESGLLFVLSRIAFLKRLLHMSSSKPIKKVPEPVEWDLSESFGILPEGLSLTHNLGCVRTPTNPKVVSSKNHHPDTTSKNPKNG